MNKFIIISSLLFFGFQSVKAQITETRIISPFHQIEVSGGVEVIYTQSDSTVLKIEAQEREISNIYTTSENGILIIKSKGIFTHPYKVFLQSKELNKIDANGATKFKTTNSISCDSLSINVSGASNVSIKTQARVIDGLMNGAANLFLEGNCNTLYSTVTGAAELKAFKLNAQNVIINTSGASSANVSVSDKIQASATGSSGIKFKGDPKEVSVEASTSSSITKILEEDHAKKSSDKKDSTEFDFKKENSSSSIRTRKMEKLQ